ncbi:uncharacterized protein BKCO1_6900011 [Diplodia corticola]|uniref:Uncharacterized protein n=1 Tax=Diplodia corticola TaxID=236234 RepID=A0A1J9QM18_9PEZI|nr:uncharacterized protein BKCO1_6900011 [Diplodia corticola]OJD29950.1 hypothetical protein BKCO1_6900011 [Diplodia corticola]
MMVTSSMISTFWKETPLPFCSRYWMLVGGTDECFWRPNIFIVLAACIIYSLAACWWYNRHSHWPHQKEAIALALLVGLGLSLALDADLEHVLRNTLTWSIFSGLIVGAVMDRRKSHRGGSSPV